MRENIRKIYPKEFYQRELLWIQDYERIAHWLCSRFSFHTVLDVGCGCGYILQVLQSSGKSVLGIEGSAIPLDFMPPALRERITIHDLRKPFNLGECDLVVCTEVAEHLAERFSDILISAICAHQPRYIVFTAATPGQRGRHHVNEQPHDYWVEKFLKFDYLFDRDGSLEARDYLKPMLRHINWIARNMMVFVRASGDYLLPRNVLK